MAGRWTAAALVATLSAATVACGGSQSAGDDSDTTATGVTSVADPVTGGRLVYGVETEPLGLDPTRAGWDATGLLVANAVFDPLMVYDAEGTPVPYLAESVEHNDDFTEWTVRLRPGVTFHDGTPFDADALAELTAAFLDSTLTGPAASRLERFEVVDDLTVRAIASEPFASWPMLLTAQGGMVASPSQLADPQGQTNPVGTGPFMIDEWVPGERLSLVRNPDYWQDGLPYLDAIDFVAIPDADSRVAALRRGDVDVIHLSNRAVIEAIADDDDLEIWRDAENAEEGFVLLNTSDAPLDDVRVRQALARATDPAAYAAALGQEPTGPTGPYPEGSPWHTDSGWPEVDLDAARSLVDDYEAEVGPIAFSIGVANTPIAVASAQELVTQWAEVGIDAQVEAVEQGNLIVDAAAGNYDALIFRQFSAPDPGGDFYWWDGTNSAPDGSIALNFARFDDEEINTGLDVLHRTDDLEERREAFAGVQRRLTEIVPYVWLEQTEWAIVTRAGVEDVLNGPSPEDVATLPAIAGWHRLTNTWISE